MTDRQWLLGAILILGGGAVAGAANAQAPESCAALAQFGTYDIRTSLKDDERAESFRNWMCQANIALESDLHQAAAALGISADVLETKFGYDPNGAVDFLDWKHGICATSHTDKRTAEQLAEFVKAVTPATATALAECDKPPGLHARLESTARQCEFVVHLSWTPDEGQTAASTGPKDVQVAATNQHVLCLPTPLETPFAVTGPTEILCTRHDDTAMVVMVASPSAHVSRVDRLMELPQALPDPQELLAGEYQVDIAWRERNGRFAQPTSDVWKLDLSTGICRITGSGTAYSPRSAWFNQAAASCSPTQIVFTGYRAFDPVTHKPAQFSLTLRSEDDGATFVGGGNDSQGNVAVQATMRHRGAPPQPDQVVCKP